MKILVGIPSLKPRDEFLRDFNLLVDNCKYYLEVLWVKDKKLVDAQNEIADKFLSSDSEALLMLEDDHWGHTHEMLDDLVSMPGDVNAISYYSRWFCLPKTCMTLTGKAYPVDYRSAPYESGIHQVDLCGFGMTLIHRRVLETLDKPIFRLNNEYADIRGVATDKNFCKRVIEDGFKIYGNFSHDLVHDGISKKNHLAMVDKWFRSINVASNRKRIRHILSKH